ncbi:MAG TPA: winged helix-turn-helix domain-containing protein [Dokdonella sp.]|uniref:winged helix-turn-helix domain-containing protein n=1 Tax=Dokdonella sp. TaxID=2291710 RepID=UPI002C3E86C0|nr:winged helix-turn-helix domain-containing protein [Dokdonella sp.]HUD41705.1 winged helix-turn-helix domain-containing protein [Dokdonella sp.]
MNQAEYRFGPYRLLPAARELWRGDRLDTPARLVFDCLAYLVQRRDRAVGRDELVAAIWGRVDIAEARVSELVVRARRAVGDDGQAQRIIRTVPGFGYRWIAEVATAADAGVEPAAAGGRDAPLDDRPIPLAAQPRRSLRPRAARVVIAAALAAIIALPLWHWQRSRSEAPTPAAAADAPHAIVLPLRIEGPSGSQWLRLGAMELIAERLSDAGLRVPPSESVLGLTRLDGRDEQAVRIALERTFGQPLLIGGSAIRAGSQWQVGLETTTADGVQHRVEATHRDAIEAARQAGDLLLAALGRLPPPAADERGDDEERLRQIQAALLANQLDVAQALFDQLAPDQAQRPAIAYQQARLHLLTGRHSAAQAALSALIAAPDVRALPLLLGKAHTLRATVQFRQAGFAAAEADFDAALVALGDLDAPAERGMALSGRGAARLAARRFDEAALDLGRARMEFERAGDAFGLAQTDANFGLLESQQGRIEQALPYLAGAADRFESLGAVERLLSVLDPLFDLHGLLLQWPDALATSDRQWALRERVRDPGQRLSLAVNRSTALAALGRLREADQVLADAAPLLARTPPTAARYYHAQRARLDLTLGRPAAAAAAADRALEVWPSEPDDWLRGQVVLARQRAAAGSTRSARLDAELDAAAARDPDQVAPALLIALAERAAADDAPGETERRYAQALASASRRGVPVDLAAAVVAQAGWLLAVGRSADAAALAGRVAPWADRDFECALLQVAVLQALGPQRTWSAALRRTQALAGERAIPAALTRAPAA